MATCRGELTGGLTSPARLRLKHGRDRACIATSRKVRTWRLRRGSGILSSIGPLSHCPKHPDPARWGHRRAATYRKTPIHVLRSLRIAELNLNSTTVVPRNFDFGVLLRVRHPNTRHRSTRSVSARRRANRRPVGELPSTSSGQGFRMRIQSACPERSRRDCSSRRTEFNDSINSPRKRRTTSGARRSRYLPSRFGGYSDNVSSEQRPSKSRGRTVTFTSRMHLAKSHE